MRLVLDRFIEAAQQVIGAGRADRALYVKTLTIAALAGAASPRLMLINTTSDDKKRSRLCMLHFRR